MSTIRYFVSGIGTGVGKTVIAAILTEKLNASYWKPVQTGAAYDSDSESVRSLISKPQKVFPESITLYSPTSPHEAAAIEKRNIQLSDFHLPVHHGPIVIEGAGGLLVPFNSKQLMFELIARFNAELILVSSNYLGSINHTLLSLDFIRANNIPFRGLIFSGVQNPASESIILEYSKARLIGKVPLLDSLTQETIVKAANYLDI